MKSKTAKLVDAAIERNQLKTYPKQIKRLEKAIDALRKYRALFGGQSSYQYSVVKSALRDLEDLLREEKRGWVA